MGPLIACDGAAARELCAAMFARLDGERVFLDAPAMNEDATGLVDELGLAEQRPFIRMYRGENKYPGDSSSIFASSGPEKG